jgi:hypothetical protein
VQTSSNQPNYKYSSGRVFAPACCSRSRPPGPKAVSRQQPRTAGGQTVHYWHPLQRVSSGRLARPAPGRRSPRWRDSNSGLPTGRLPGGCYAGGPTCGSLAPCGDRWSPRQPPRRRAAPHRPSRGKRLTSWNSYQADQAQGSGQQDLLGLHLAGLSRLSGSGPRLRRITRCVSTLTGPRSGGSSTTTRLRRAWVASMCP